MSGCAPQRWRTYGKLSEGCQCLITDEGRTVTAVDLSVGRYCLKVEGGRKTREKGDWNGVCGKGI